MYQIKQLPEDFVVKERLNLNIDGGGEYSYFLMKKIGYSTFGAIEAVARKLRIKPKFINAAGLKDKNAVTEQFISINRGPRSDVPVNSNLSLKYAGSGKDRLNIGVLEGNDFEIVVRNLERRDLEGGAVPKRISYMANYFDEQRFGRDSDNHLIGRMLVKKQFREAAAALKEKGYTEVSAHLEKTPADAVGALRRIPGKLLRFYISAYQSSLWNRCVKEYLESAKAGNISVSLDEKFQQPGFDAEEPDPAKQKILDMAMASDGVKPADFIIRQIPELTAEAQERRIFAKIENLSFSGPEEDELNPGMLKMKVSFSLGKSSYATNAVREIFS